MIHALSLKCFDSKQLKCSFFYTKEYSLTLRCSILIHHCKLVSSQCNKSFELNTELKTHYYLYEYLCPDLILKIPMLPCYKELGQGILYKIVSFPNQYSILYKIRRNAQFNLHIVLFLIDFQVFIALQ